MKPFNKAGKFGKKDGGKRKRKDFGGPKSDYSGGYENKRDRHDYGRPQRRGQEVELYEAVCANCGQKCEVPFRPTGSRPVYCRSCFQQNEAGDSFERRDHYEPRRKSRDRFASKPGGGSFSAELDNINRKLDKIMEALDIDE